MLKKVLFLLMTLEIAAMAIPMESLNEYNLVLIHGAGSHWGGLDCENGDIKHEKNGFPKEEQYQEAYKYYSLDPNRRIGGKFSEGLIWDDSTSSARQCPLKRGRCSRLTMFWTMQEFNKRVA